MPNIYKINVSPKPLTNLTAVLTFTDDSTSTRTDWIEADTYYTITETTIKTLKSLTVSANNYITQTLETSDLDIDITLSPNIKYVSKIKNNGVVYTLKDESVDGKVEGLANKTLSNVSSIDNNSAVTTALNGKQATLVSGTNIKTINNTSLLGSGNIDANNIFIAEYGVTSYSDIDTAYNAGKMLFVVEGDFYYPLMSADSSGYVFSSPDSDGIYQVYISSDGTWSGNEYGFPTKISDLTDDTSTYPISKADTLTGLTATISELNILDGATLSTTELNYVDGVTSSIQTQLNNKQDTLVSGTNIKTINNNSLLGSGDITIDSLPSQSGQSGKFLTTNGTTASWSTVSIPTVDQIFDSTSTNAQSGVAIGNELVNYVNGRNGNIEISNDGVLADITYSYIDNDTLQEQYSVQVGATMMGHGTLIGAKDYTDSEDLKEFGVAVIPEGFGISDGNQNVLLNISNNNLTVNGTEVALTTDIPDISTKQDTLVSGTNIKTVNNTSLLGSGNLSVGTVTSVNNTAPVNGDVTISIPTVNNATLTIQKNGTTVNTFTANSSSDVTANITVPTDTSDLTNNAGFITNSALSGYVQSTDLATVATSGSYNDLSNKPTIPNAQIQSDWNQTDNNAVDFIKNKPTIPSGVVVDQTYDGTSTNAQSGVAIAGAGFLTSIPSTYLQNTATGGYSLTLLGSITNKIEAVNIGYMSSIGGQGSVAIGASARTTNSYGVAIGHSASAGYWATAIGGDSDASGHATAIGYNASAYTNAIQLGYGTNSSANTLNVGFYNDSSTHYNWQLLDGTTGLIPDARISSNIARTSAIPTVPTNISAFTNDSEYITSSALTDYVTTNTDQNITGTKTYVGQKKIGFKQSSSSDKLGFTLYNNSGTEKGYLEYNPSNTVDSVPLMTLGNYATASGGLTHVGFRKYSSISGANGAYNLLAPLISDAKTPFNLTTTYTNFYLPLGFTDGTTTVTTAKSGLCDLSSILPDISTKQDTLVSGTNIKTINNTSLLGSGNIKVAPDEGSKSTDTLYVGSNTSLYEGINSTGLGYRHNVTGIANIAIGTTATAGDNIGTYIEPVYTTNCIAIGVGATAQVNSSIQIGRGTNPTANSLNVGFTDAKTNYQLLDGTTGLIPDARISTNIARTSSVADSTLSNVSSISSNSAVATALDSKVNTSDIWYDSTSKTLYIGVAQS